jgi:hypothetical protein
VDDPARQTYSMRLVEFNSNSNRNAVYSHAYITFNGYIMTATVKLLPVIVRLFLGVPYSHYSGSLVLLPSKRDIRLLNKVIGLLNIARLKTLISISL